MGGLKAACRRAVGDRGTLKSGSQAGHLSHRASTPATSTTASQAGETTEHGYDSDIVESVKQIRNEVPMLAKALACSSQEITKRLHEERSARRATEVFFDGWIKRVEREVSKLNKLNSKSCSSLNNERAESVKMLQEKSLARAGR